MGPHPLRIYPLIHTHLSMKKNHIIILAAVVAAFLLRPALVFGQVGTVHTEAGGVVQGNLTIGSGTAANSLTVAANSTLTVSGTLDAGNATSIILPGGNISGNSGNINIITEHFLVNGAPVGDGPISGNTTLFFNGPTNGTYTLPSNGTLLTVANLTSNVSGTLPVANGGTGLTSFGNSSLFGGNATGLAAQITLGSNLAISGNVLGLTGNIANLTANLNAAGYIPAADLQAGTLPSTVQSNITTLGTVTTGTLGIGVLGTNGTVADNGNIVTGHDLVNYTSPFASGTNFLFIGDSLTFGNGSTSGYDYPSQVMLLPGFSGGVKYNLGVGGYTLDNLIANYTTAVHPYAPATTGVPAVAFVWIGANESPNGGIGAAATSTITANAVTALTFSNNGTGSGSGTGYGLAPTVSFSGGGGSGAAATVTIATTGANTGQINGYTITNGGSGYATPPAVAFTVANPVLSGANEEINKLNYYYSLCSADNITVVALDVIAHSPGQNIGQYNDTRMLLDQLLKHDTNPWRLVELSSQLNDYSDTTWYNGDGVHLNNTSYGLVAAMVNAAVSYPAQVQHNNSSPLLFGNAFSINPSTGNIDITNTSTNRATFTGNANNEAGVSVYNSNQGSSAISDTLYTSPDGDATLKVGAFPTNYNSSLFPAGGSAIWSTGTTGAGLGLLIQCLGSGSKVGITGGGGGTTSIPFEVSNIAIVPGTAVSNFVPFSANVNGEGGTVFQNTNSGTSSVTETKFLSPDGNGTLKLLESPSNYASSSILGAGGSAWFESGPGGSLFISTNTTANISFSVGGFTKEFFFQPNGNFTAANLTTGGAVNAVTANITGAATFSGVVNANATTAATSNTTGAIVDAGGLGVAGNIYYAGTLNGVSDVGLKDDIQPISEAADAILSLHPISYVRSKAFEKTHPHAPIAREIGVSAQELETLIPEAVTHGSDGNLYVQYDKLIAPTIAAVQQLHARELFWERTTGILVLWLLTLTFRLHRRTRQFR